MENPEKLATKGTHDGENIEQREDEIIWFKKHYFPPVSVYVGTVPMMWYGLFFISFY